MCRPKEMRGAMRRRGGMEVLRGGGGRGGVMRRLPSVASTWRRLGATTVEAQWRVAWRSGTEEYGTTGYWIGSERQLVLEIAATAMATTTTEATTTSTKVRSWLRGRMSEISHATACVVRAAVALCLIVCVVAVVGISWTGRVEWRGRS